MRKITSIIAILTCSISFSQHGFLNSSDFLNDSLDSKFAINVYGEGFLNSNSVSNYVFNKAYQGSSLEGDLKSNIFDRLQEENKVIVDGYAGTNLYYIDEERKQLFTASFERRTVITSTFNEDFTKLLLNGNQPYQNEILDIGGLNYEQQSYQAYKLGYVKKLDALGLAFGANLGYVQGLSYQSVQIDDGELLTATDGESIDFDVKGQIIQPSSQSGNNGIELDFYIEKYVKGNNKFAFKINDLGFVNWKNLTAYNADNSYSFEGIVIEDLFNIDTSAFSDLQDKSNAQEILGLEEETISKRQWLPSLLQLDYTHLFSDKFALSAGILYRTTTGALPALDLEADYKLPFGLTLIGELDYGGYGRLNYAVGGKISLLKDKFFLLGKFYVLESLVAASGTSGEGANVYAYYIF